MCICLSIVDYYSGIGKPINQLIIAIEKIVCYTLSF